MASSANSHIFKLRAQPLLPNSCNVCAVLKTDINCLIMLAVIMVKLKADMATKTAVIAAVLMFIHSVSGKFTISINKFDQCYIIH